MNKYFIYCRKSSEQEDRQILSLDSQESELKNLAKENNLEVVGVYKESGSAHTIGRRAFNEMLTRVENKEANGLIVWDESRIARNSLDGGKVIYMMDLGQIAEIHKPGKIYKNTPDDKSWLGMIFMMTKKDSDDKGVNVKRGLKTKAEKGYLPSGAKPGYMNDKYEEKGNKKIKSDPIRFPLVQKAIYLVINGECSASQALQKLNEWGYRTPKHKKLGGKPMHRSMWYRVLADPFYYGEYEYPKGSGTWHKGKHEPMIIREEFDKLQILLGRKGRLHHKPHIDEFPFKVMRCGECGAGITAEEKWQIICPSCRFKFASQNKEVCPRCQVKIEDMVKPTILHYIYYHCTKKVNPNCSQGGIRVEELEKQIDELLSKVQISERFKNWAIKYLNELSDKEVDDRNTSLEALQEAYNDVLKKVDNLVKLFTCPQNSNEELLTTEEYKAQKEPLMREKARLEELMQDTGDRVNKWVELSEKTFEFACYARYWFADGNTATKRQIFSSLGQNLILKDKIVRVELEKPLQWIEEAKNEVPSVSLMLEPEKEFDNTLQLEPLWAQNPSLLPG